LRPRQSVSERKTDSRELIAILKYHSSVPERFNSGKPLNQSTVENSLLESVVKVCKILNTHSVQYSMVRGTAVALHGYFRLSHDPSGRLMEKHDLDFWYNPTYNNYFRLLEGTSFEPIYERFCKNCKLYRPIQFFKFKGQKM
jgi:hypothetical protein